MSEWNKKCTYKRAYTVLMNEGGQCAFGSLEFPLALKIGRDSIRTSTKNSVFCWKFIHTHEKEYGNKCTFEIMRKKKQFYRSVFRRFLAHYNEIEKKIGYIKCVKSSIEIKRAYKQMIKKWMKFFPRFGSLIAHFLIWWKFALEDIFFHFHTKCCFIFSLFYSTFLIPNQQTHDGRFVGRFVHFFSFIPKRSIRRPATFEHIEVERKRILA